MARGHTLPPLRGLRNRDVDETDLVVAAGQICDRQFAVVYRHCHGCLEPSIRSACCPVDGQYTLHRKFRNDVGEVGAANHDVHRVTTIWQCDLPHGISHVNQRVVTLIRRETIVAVAGLPVDTHIPAVGLTVAASAKGQTTIDEITGKCGTVRLEANVADRGAVPAAGVAVKDAAGGRLLLVGGTSSLKICFFLWRTKNCRESGPRVVWKFSIQS